MNILHGPMHMALHRARRAHRVGEVPVGAVIVQQGRIIASNHNHVERWQSPLAHAEMLVILMAQRRLRSKYLDQCSMYVTLQPCPMCAHALSLARLKRVYFGAYETGHPFGGPEWIGGVLETSCHQLLTTFFSEKR